MLPSTDEATEYLATANLQLATKQLQPDQPMTQDVTTPSTQSTHRLGTCLGQLPILAVHPSPLLAAATETTLTGVHCSYKRVGMGDRSVQSLEWSIRLHSREKVSQSCCLTLCDVIIKTRAPWHVPRLICNPDRPFQATSSCGN